MADKTGRKVSAAAGDAADAAKEAADVAGDAALKT